MQRFDGNDHAPRQHQALLLKDADDLGVAHRLAGVFALDDLLDPLLEEVEVAERGPLERGGGLGHEGIDAHGDGAEAAAAAKSRDADQEREVASAEAAAKIAGPRGVQLPGE